MIPERKIHRERLEAIRDWHLPKYSTGVHVSRDETVQMASRVLAAEAKVAELEATIDTLNTAARELSVDFTRIVKECVQQHDIIERTTRGYLLLKRLTTSCVSCAANSQIIEETVNATLSNEDML